MVLTMRQMVKVLTNPTDYQVDAFVDQLDRNGATIKSYTLRGVFPEIAAIELNTTNDAIEEFECNICVPIL